MKKIFHVIRQKYNNMTKPVKASLWFTMCNIIQRGLQFIGMPIYTRIMSTEEYGVYSVFMSWFNIICVFSTLSIYHGTFNKAMVKYEKERDRYISSIQSLTLIIAMVFSLVIVIFNKVIYEWTGYSLKFQLLLCVHLMMFPTLQYWAQKQRFLFEYKPFVAVTILNSIASLVLGTLFVFISEEKGFALVAVTVIVQAVINICIFVSLARKGRCVYDKEYWKWTIATSVPLIPHYLSEILLGHADRIMIGQMCGGAQAGIYNIVYQISMVMTIIRTGINGAFTPWLYYSLKEKRYLKIRKVTKMLTLLMWAMTIMFMLLGPEILKIVAAPAYYEAVIDIPAIMIACFFIFVYVLFLNVEIYYEQNQFVALASIISAIVNVFLNYVCINRFGYLAAGYTTMISYGLMAIMHFLFLHRIIKMDNELKEVFEFKFLLVVSIILIIMGAIILRLYEFTLLRWILIIILIVVIIMKKNSILELLKEMKKREI